jgi:exopolyphosphatase
VIEEDRRRQEWARVRRARLENNCTSAFEYCDHEKRMPKLIKKHRTFDCDLSGSMITNNTPANTDTHATQLSDQTTDCLSKLVLSSSLHQLADLKYHTNNLANKNNKINNNNCLQNAGNMNLPVETTNAMPNDQTNTPTTTTTTTATTTTTPTPSKSNHNNDAKTHSPNVPKKREANLDTVHVVVGNESCDLDSAVSCLLMFHIISKMSDEINGKDKTRTLYIPLLNTTRDMLDSKCEVLWFLQKTLNIDKSFLTCKDDIDWNEIKKNGVEVLVTLVDHNYNEEFKDIGRIVEIIDHHQVQNPEWLMANHANIRLTLDTSVGSCTTLVAERLFYIYAEHHVSDEILLLIYGTVLLDTICLSEKAKRFTRRDVYLLKKLDYLLGSKKPVRDELYKQLVDVKNSFKELNFEKLMKRDLKVFKDKHGMQVGIASLFGMAAQEALGLAANIDLDQFFRQNNYEAFVIMGLVADLDHSDSISRDLVLISANKRLFDELCQAFEQDTSKLDLVPIGSDSSPDPEDNIINNRRIVDSSNDSSPFYKARIWSQRNVTSSRKVVAPLVLKVLHDSAQ